MGSTKVDLWDCNKIILNFFIFHIREKLFELYWVRELIICWKAFTILNGNCCWKGISKLIYANLIIIIRKVNGMSQVYVFLVRNFLLFHLRSIMAAHGSSNMHKGPPLIFVEIFPPVIFHRFPEILICLDVIDPFQKLMMIIPALLCLAIMICFQFGPWRAMVYFSVAVWAKASVAAVFICFIQKRSIHTSIPFSQQRME